MALFVPLDVDYQLDPKIIAAGAISECLFVRSLAVAKRTLSDGFIARAQLPSLALGLPGSSARHASKLVEVGLWAEVEGGWVIVAWLKRNESAAAINAITAKKKAGAVLANHVKWHTDKPKPGCPHCDEASEVRSVSDRGSDQTPRDSLIPRVETETETETEVDPEEEVETETETEPTSSSSPCDSGKAPLRAVDDDDGFIARVIAHIASIRTQAQRPRNVVAYKSTVSADLYANHVDAIRAEHRRCPDLDPARLAEHYEARPDLHLGGCA